MTAPGAAACLGFAIGVLGGLVVGASVAELLRDDPGFRPRRRLAVLGLLAIAAGASLVAR